MDNITVSSSKDALPGVAYTSPVFVTDVHNFNINITTGTGGVAATSKPQSGLLNQVKNALCGLPAISPSVGADLYAVLGGSLGGGLNIDIANGQFGLSGFVAVGIGAGFDIGPGVSAGPSVSSVVSANLALGAGFAVPVGPGVNVGGSVGYNVFGTDEGFSGGAIGRFGTPLGYVNGGANFGFNTPSLYSLGCKK